MVVWNDPERWSALCSGVECPICQRQQPLDVILDLGDSWLTMQQAAPVVGYVCLVSRTHAVELHDLPEEAAIRFMRDARRVSAAVASATNAVKLNYEIHGNSLPHLHMHFFPRYRGDQFEGQPINPKRVVQPVYAQGEFQKVRDSILYKLQASSPA
jgi:diadenosine tetraphosphate (Ap4A) HIT family hydrolase